MSDNDPVITPAKAKKITEARQEANEPQSGKAADRARADAREAELERQATIRDAVADLEDPGTAEAEPVRVAAPRSVSWENPGNPGHDFETGEPV